MLAVERRAKIEETIETNKSVLVTELAKQFNVTPETIRGDLLKLEKQGILTRTYGGAVLAGNTGQELDISERDGLNSDVKQRIGKKAAEIIRAGETIFLDASTSALHLARNLKGTRGITVITNSRNIVSELADLGNIRIISTGGILSAKNMSYTGRFAEKMIRENFAANKFFFSCKGITLSRGLTDSSEDEAEIKRAMMDCSDTVIFLCDHNKIGRMGIPIISGIDRLDEFITDVHPDRELRGMLEKYDVTITVV